MWWRTSSCHQIWSLVEDFGPYYTSLSLFGKSYFIFSPIILVFVCVISLKIGVEGVNLKGTMTAQNHTGGGH